VSTSPKSPLILLEGAIAITMGLCFWWIADKHLAQVHMLDPWNTADMADYCNAILHLNGDTDVPWSVKRSKITAWLAAPIAAQDGIMSGLRASSIVAQIGVGAGLYLWGRFASGRTAGVLAVMAALALGPLVLLSRILTFYPMVAAFLVMGAALATAGIVSKNPKHLALTGIGIGIALLADVRGLIWAGPWGLAALWAAWRSEAPSTALRWLLTPILLSFCIGMWSYPEGAVSLEAQMDARPLFHMYGSKIESHQPPWDTGGAFVWGRTAPWDWIHTIAFMVEQLRLEIPEGFPPRVSRFAADNHMGPLVPVWWASAGLCFLLLARKPKALVAVIATVLPFALAFNGQANLAEIRVRFLCQILPGLAVLIGIGLGTLVDDFPSIRGRARWSTLRRVVAYGILLATVTGTVSTIISPWARWRRPWPVIGELLLMHPNAKGRETVSDRKRPCVEQLTRDAAAGHWIPPLRGRLNLRDAEDPADPTRR